MSCTVSIKTKIKNLEVLKKSFTDLGWVIKHDQPIREHIVRKDKYADVAINPRNGHMDYDVGIAPEKDGTYRLDTDTWGGSVATQLGNRSGTYGKLLGKYSENLINDMYCLDGYTVENRKEQEDGSVLLELVK